MAASPRIENHVDGERAPITNLPRRGAAGSRPRSPHSRPRRCAGTGRPPSGPRGAGWATLARRAAAPGRRPPRRRIRRAPRGARARSVDGDARLLLLLHHHRVVLLHHLIVLHRRLLTLLPLALLHALRLHLAVVLPPRSVLLHLVLLRLVFLHPVRLHRVALGERLPNDARDPEGQPGRYDHPPPRAPAREPPHARLLG